MKKLFFYFLLCGGCFLMPGYATADPFASMNIEPVSSENEIFATDFELEQLDGTTVSLRDFRGNVILLNFWATWCFPCIREMPDMEVLWHKYKDAEFVILGVSNDDAGKRKRVATFIKKANLSFPILLDPESRISDLYGVSGIPVSFLIDRNGEILAKIVGEREWANPEAFKLVEHLLKLQP